MTATSTAIRTVRVTRLRLHQLKAAALKVEVRAGRDGFLCVSYVVVGGHGCDEGVVEEPAGWEVVLGWGGVRIGLVKIAVGRHPKVRCGDQL